MRKRKLILFFVLVLVIASTGVIAQISDTQITTARQFVQVNAAIFGALDAVVAEVQRLRDLTLSQQAQLDGHTNQLTTIQSKNIDQDSAITGLQSKDVSQDAAIASGGGGGTWSAVFQPLLGVARSDAIAGGTTYYLHSLAAPADGLQSTEALVLSQETIPVTGHLTYFCVSTNVTGNLASAESISFTVRVNGVDAPLVVTQVWNVREVVGVAVGSVAIVTGDKISVRLSTPAWTVLPSAVYVHVSFRVTP